MANTYRGRIEAIEGIQSIAREGKEPWQTRRVMLDVSRYDGLTGEKRERHVIFDFNGKNVAIPNGFNVGDYAEVTFDVESYKGTKKDGTITWFTRVAGYRMEKVEVYTKNEQKPQPVSNPISQPQVQPVQQVQNNSNCPF